MTTMDEKIELVLFLVVTAVTLYLVCKDNWLRKSKGEKRDIEERKRRINTSIEKIQAK